MASTSSTSQPHPQSLSTLSFLSQIDTELNALLRKDPILSDLADTHLTLESAEAQLAFESGQGVRLLLKRADNTTLPILIKKKDTVRGLKNRIQTETERELMLVGGGGRQINNKINWRMVWRQNWLVLSDNSSGGVKLEDDKAHLIDVGLVNNTEIRFVKKMRERKRGLKLKRK